MARNADRPTAPAVAQDTHHVIEPEVVRLRIYALRADCEAVFGATYTAEDMRTLQRYTDSVVRAAAQFIHTELICRSEFAAAQALANYVTPALKDVAAADYMRVILSRVVAEVNASGSTADVADEINRLFVFAEGIPSNVCVRVREADAHLYDTRDFSNEQSE